MFIRVKGKIYRAIVLSTLYIVQTTGEKAACLHDATSAFEHENNLDGQTDKQDILELTGLPSMEDLLIRKNLRWTGLMRMSQDRLSKQILYFQLSSGHRTRGRPRQSRLQFKDTIKRNLKLRDIKTDSWTSLSQQRDKRKAIVK